MRNKIEKRWALYLGGGQRWQIRECSLSHEKTGNKDDLWPKPTQWQKRRAGAWYLFGRGMHSVFLSDKSARERQKQKGKELFTSTPLKRAVKRCVILVSFNDATKKEFEARKNKWSMSDNDEGKKERKEQHHFDSRCAELGFPHYCCECQLLFDVLFW